MNFGISSIVSYGVKHGCIFVPRNDRAVAARTYQSLESTRSEIRSGKSGMKMRERLPYE